MSFRATLAGITIALTAFAAQAQERVVYHIDDAATQALKGLRNIRNHLDTEPAAKITVVTHANGVDFLMEGAKDGNGAPLPVRWQRSRHAASPSRSARSRSRTAA